MYIARYLGGVREREHARSERVARRGGDERRVEPGEVARGALDEQPEERRERDGLPEQEEEEREGGTGAGRGERRRAAYVGRSRESGGRLGDQTTSHL